MGYLIAVICIVLALFASKIENKWYNPATIMLGTWAIILAFYELKLFGIYDVDESTYFTISVGLLFFFVGYLLATGSNRLVVVGKSDGLATGEVINYKLLNICGIIVFLFFLEEAIETFVLMAAGNSLFDIRTSLQGYADYEFSDNLYVLRSMIGPLYTWFILPVYNSMLIITCINLFSEKRNNLLLFLSVGCLLLKSIKEGSRVALFIFVIYLVFSMVIYGRTITLSSKLKRRIRLFALVAVILIVVISIVRLSSGEKALVEEIYLYFTCCVPLWDHWLSVLSNAGGGYTFGATSLYGILQFPATALSVLVGHSLDWYTAGAQAITDTETFIQIRNASYSYRSNAYTTFLYYFYKDGGMLGILLGSTLFGYVATDVYKRMKYHISRWTNAPREVFLYLLIVQTLILSFIRIYFSVASYSFTIFYAFIFIRRSYSIDEEET